MVKLVIYAILLCGASVLANSSELKCSGINDAPDNWIDMASNCTNAVRRQIQMEVNASYTYMAMAAYFSRDEVNMPGFAKMFFESASEERSHALALVEYLLMRGPAKADQKFTEDLISTPEMRKETWKNGLDALKAALDTEVSVTRSIKNVIATCQKGTEDYHLNDYLTAEFLDEQYKGQRELAGKISTLSKMMRNSESLGLFLYDKELLG